MRIKTKNEVDVRHCLRCDQAVPDGRPHSKYCSKYCSNAIYLHECKYCGKAFRTTVKQSKYCTRECAARSYENSISVECTGCGKPFRRKASQLTAKFRRHYCTRRCYFSNRRFPARRCKVCKSTFTPIAAQQIYCDGVCQLSQQVTDQRIFLLSRSINTILRTDRNVINQ